MAWLQTFITLIAGSVLTIVVGEISRRSISKQDWAKTRQVKLEETFAEMANVETQTIRIAMQTVQRKHGLEPAGDEPPVDLTRLGALISLYFPEARVVLAAHRKRMQAMSDLRVAKFKEAALRKDAKDLDGIGLMMALDMNKEVGQFGRELRPILEGIAAKLSQ